MLLQNHTQKLNNNASVTYPQLNGNRSSRNKVRSKTRCTVTFRSPRYNTDYTIEGRISVGRKNRKNLGRTKLHSSDLMGQRDVFSANIFVALLSTPTLELPSAAPMKNVFFHGYYQCCQLPPPLLETDFPTPYSKPYSLDTTYQ